MSPITTGSPFTAAMVQMRTGLLPETSLAQGIALIDGAWVGAAYTPAEARNAEQKALLELSDALIAELKAADAIVIGAPVYNFGVTGPLKAWIDQICRVGETFAYTETGPMGLLADKPVYVAYASGGVPMGSAYDFSSAYLRQVLAFVGLTNVQFVAAEGVPGGFANLYKVLTAFEDAGRCQRGYFIESLGAAQFAQASTVDRLRGYLDGVDPARPEYRAVALAAADPANPYGAALSWPAHPGSARPGRKAGALVVLVDGELVWFVERGGRSVLNFATGADADAVQRAAAGALAGLIADRRIDGILIERVDGASVLELRDAPTPAALTDAGFARTPRGLRMR